MLRSKVLSQFTSQNPCDRVFSNSFRMKDASSAVVLSLIICDFSFHSETGPGYRWMVNSSCQIKGWCTGNRGFFPRGSAVKNPPAMPEMQVQSLSQEDPLEKEMATHSYILAWKIPWTEEPGKLQSERSQRVRHD